MKKFMFMLSLVLIVSVMLVGCTEAITYDYTTVEFEEALTNGEDVVGKTVQVKVEVVDKHEVFGYNIQSGEQSNFVSEVDPEVAVGDTIIVTVVEAREMFGSFIIVYTR